MHQHFWSDDETRREAARKLEAKLREAAAKRAAASEMVSPPYEVAPAGFEFDESRTSATTIRLINVLLDDWRYFASEITALTREAHDLHQIESGADIEF